VLHLLRIFFTGAYRKPRELTYLVGVTMLVLALVEGYLGYSLVDDLLSGMGLAIGYSVLLSIPLIGANLGQLLWGAPFPGAPNFEPRMFIVHVLLLPIAIGTLLGLHLLVVASRHHTQFRGRRQSQRRVVGIPAFPGQAPRSLGLFFAVAALLVLLGGLAQINPIWLWGPYHVASSTNGAQPDWYLGWLIGALRLMPGWDLVIGRHTVVPNPGRRSPPRRRVRLPLPVAVARAPRDPPQRLGQPARSLARPSLAHRSRRGAGHVALRRLPRRLRRSRHGALRDLVSGPDLGLPGGLLRRPGRRVARDPACLRRARRERARGGVAPSGRDRRALELDLTGSSRRHPRDGRASGGRSRRVPARSTRGAARRLGVSTAG
jgi:hypothetical protein